MKKTCINILILLFAGYCINFFSCDYPDGCHYHYSDENYDIKPLYLINLQDYEQLKIKYSYSDSLLSIYNNDKLVDSLIDGNSIDIVKYISYREEKQTQLSLFIILKNSTNIAYPVTSLMIFLFQTACWMKLKNMIIFSLLQIDIYQNI